MSLDAVPAISPVEDADLATALEQSLRSGAARPAIVRLERRASAYRTSFVLEEIDALLSDGRVLPLILKDVGPESLHESARAAKPAFLYSPRREIALYRALPPSDRPGTARLYGSEDDETRGRFWLLLERVPGVELYQLGDLESWMGAAEWLARFHARWSAAPARLDEVAREAGLIRYDAHFYRRWIDRALQFQRAGPTGELAWLAERYEGVIEGLLRLPPTLIHGEFYASNVLVRKAASRIDRVCPVDWEVAAVGPGLVDLAALVAGEWSQDERELIVRAYSETWAEVTDSRMPFERLRHDLAFCRLHLAVQWLGWSPTWSPPREHARNWLAVALELADQLAL